MLAVMYDVEHRIPEFKVSKREYVLRVARNSSLDMDYRLMKGKMNRDDCIVLRVGYKLVNSTASVKVFLDDIVEKYGGKVTNLNENMGMGSLVFSKEIRDNGRRLMDEENFLID